MRYLKSSICLLFLGSSIAFSSPSIPAGASFDVGFSPYGKGLQAVLKGIKSAKKSILVATYSFTSKPIAVALLEAHKQGISVKVVADEKDSRKQYSATQFLANHGIPVRTNGNYAIHHNKFMVIDGQTLETGSFNYTAAAASRNAENVLLLWNVPPIAQVYAKEWKRLWDEGSDLKGNY